jgi:HK97 gp10 family phage protein
MPLSIQVAGFQEVERTLKEFAPKLRRKALRKALKAGGDVIATEVKLRAPVRTDVATGRSNALPPGALRADITVQVQTSSNEVAGVAKIGPSPKTDHVARWVEFGHRMVTHRPGQRQIGQVPAHPFMRPAFDSSRDEAVAAFGDTLLQAVAEMGTNV